MKPIPATAGGDDVNESARTDILVTIVTPSYNRADFLPETIESVLAQDYEHIEHLVLDDGSTDDTLRVLTEYERRYPDRFHWVRHENMGQPKTLNRGFALARGEALIILNSDDTLLDGAVSKLVVALESDRNAVAAFPDFRVIDEDGGTVVELLAPSYSFCEMVRTQNNFLGPGVLFKKSMADRLGGWDESYRVAPDLDFWLRGGLLGEYIHVPEVLATWRQHSGSITVAAPGSEAIGERFRLLQAFFSTEDLPDEIRVLEADAYRNAYFIAALTVLPGFNRPEDRFIVYDRLAWAQDSRARGRTVESDLLAEQERARHLESGLSEQQVIVQDLRQRLAAAGRELDASHQELDASHQELEVAHRELDERTAMTLELNERFMAADRELARLKSRFLARAMRGIRHPHQAVAFFRRRLS